MMLLDKTFYRVKEQTTEDTKLRAVLQIHPENEIFKGHFPDIPIVPGVCMLQIVRELTEKKLEKILAISEVSNMKFISAFNPLEHNSAVMEISHVQMGEGYKVMASLTDGPTVFFKLNAIFK